MSFWVEVHCDAAVKGTDKPARMNDSGCASFNSENPGALADRVTVAGKNAKSAAIQAGWKRLYFGWCCPSCERKLRP